MTWPRTDVWWPAVQEIVAEIDDKCDGVVPWRPRYGAIFGDRQGLLDALRYFWQIDTDGRASRSGPDESGQAGHPGLQLLFAPTHLKSMGPS
ncbi:MAG: hypothetical protein QOI02_1529 [Actinomycetota bacterium]|jgi:hypothetical protein|nr:hypothetical protein [Actinomycetota bacterium]